MLAKVHSCAVLGLEGAIVVVEVDTARGLPNFIIVGLPDTAVQESRERVRFAIRNAGFYFPPGKVAVNLAPAALRKEGPAYDLAIALGVLIATGQIRPDGLEHAIVLGEVSMDGAVRHIRGVLPRTALAQREGFRRVIVPADDAAEAALIPEIEVLPARSLTELVNHLSGIAPIKAQRPAPMGDLRPQFETDFREIKGQEHVKRAMEVAAAGSHNILLSGPPGAGKTLLARSVPSILPRMTVPEALDVTQVYSIADQLPSETPLIQLRPFRAPHHTISHAGLVGGGNWPRPGEISLAHQGVLFLDELPEFGRQVLEVLRQPLEDKIVTISRARGSLSFPADFMLIAAMNPCPCGYFGDAQRECSCSSGTVTRYQKRISGPLLDRIDIHVEVPRVDFEKLTDDRLGESSAAIRARVEAARDRQRARFEGTDLGSNAGMGPTQIRTYCQLDEAGRALIRQAMHSLQMTARAFHRVLKLSRTIADLAGSEAIENAHLAEALQYRPRRW